MQDTDNGGHIRIDDMDNLVVRPTGPWSSSVHMLLNHIEYKGFKSAPKMLGIDDAGNEILSYLQGDVYDYPLRGPIATEQALKSAGKLLRQYHDATADFLAANQDKPLCWMLPARKPEEVICHGDFAPYNVVLQKDRVVGIVDFDAAHPAPRIWDIAYAVYCWAPLKTNPYDALGSLPVQVQRMRIFCQAYGFDDEEYTHLVDWIILRVQAQVYFMVSRAQDGDLQYVQNINDGLHLAYIEDIEHLKRNKNEINRLLLSENGAAIC
jgi:Ser/Thr protein kinase RdoA (MazF antagonist)